MDSAMNEKIAAIRKLLDELEAGSSPEEAEAFQKGFSGFELASIIEDVVDFLSPILTPYEVVIYWYLFRHSVLVSGAPYVRASMQQLRKSGRTSYKRGGQFSENQLMAVLRSLQEKGAIRKESEPNQKGTLYRVMIPEEIEVCRVLMQERQESDVKLVIPEKEVDYYNIRENRLQIYERDDYKCKYCGKQLTRFTATLDHIVPVAKGGENSYENLITACLSCNSQKNQKPVGDFLADT